MDVQCYSILSYISKFSTLRQPCQKMIIWLNAGYICTQSLSIHSLKQAILVSYISGLYWKDERFERMTWNAHVTPVQSSFSFPLLAQWLAFGIPWLTGLQYPKLSFTVFQRYVPRTLTALLLSSLARNILIVYKITVCSIMPVTWTQSS
jgi:hypothetical protein